MDQLTGIGHRERAGQTKRQREFGRDTNKYVKVDGEGFLQIHGAGEQKAVVSVSPASLENIVGKSNEFLNSSKQGSTTIFAIANWKFGVLMGGVLTLFTLLYVGYSLKSTEYDFKRSEEDIDPQTCGRNLKVVVAASHFCDRT